MNKSTDERLKMIDRIIAVYKAKRLRIQAQEVQQDAFKEDAASRMITGYNKNRDKIEKRPKQPEVPQTEKRKRKLADLISRSSSWRNLT
jgi:hypothetical protein